MFHVKHEQLRDVARWAGIPLAADLEARLAAVADWLATEGIEAGGIGPNEGPQVWERHILDSLMFAGGWEELPDEVVDVGTGIGLPGIPLAVAVPQVRWVLVDRSGRRIRLIRRAIRRFELANAEAVESEADAFFAGGGRPAVVMRGVFQPDALEAFVGSAVSPGGRLVVGAGREPVPVLGSELIRFPGSSVLAPGRWLRIMRRP